jgi:fructose-1,6-bisphosphatase/inositol monophosphatase family enzyme
VPAADPDALLALAVALAEEAGALLLEGQDRVRTSVETKSTGTDMVTEMDRASERLVVDGILAVRPDDGILGEEGSAREGTSGVRWIIDPLDGTTNYLYGFLAYGVSIGVEVDGVPTAGVVRDPVHGETWTATAGGGAWCDGRRLQVGGPPSLATALVGTGFAYDSARRAEQAEVLRAVLPRVRDVRRAGAAAVDLCWVAGGRLDAFFERGLAPWDWAAGSLIAAEAGAVAQRFDDDGLHVAAPPHLFDPLLALVRPPGPPT